MGDLAGVVDTTDLAAGVLGALLSGLARRRLPEVSARATRPGVVDLGAGDGVEAVERGGGSARRARIHLGDGHGRSCRRRSVRISSRRSSSRATATTKANTAIVTAMTISPGWRGSAIGRLGETGRTEAVLVLAGVARRILAVGTALAYRGVAADPAVVTHGDLGACSTLASESTGSRRLGRTR